VPSNGSETFFGTARRVPLGPLGLLGLRGRWACEEEFALARSARVEQRFQTFIRKASSRAARAARAASCARSARPLRLARRNSGWRGALVSNNASKLLCGEPPRVPLGC
jgi:hypothetical protein